MCINSISRTPRIGLKCFVDQTDSKFTHAGTIPSPGPWLGRLF
jgi:hypothetical protein